MDYIAVIDFGGQYAHLIASRIRRLGVLARVFPASTSISHYQDAKGIVLSGGPQSVSAPGALTVDPALLTADRPVLGICYGLQAMVVAAGGKVKKGTHPEYGPAHVSCTSNKSIFSSLKKKEPVWMSHFDEVARLPKDWVCVGSTPSCSFAAAMHATLPLFGIQFHPEVTHTACGEKLLAAFVEKTGAKKSWSMKAFLTQKMKELKKHVGSKKVFFLVSGGVDSTVAFALLTKAVGASKVTGLLIDTGLMREKEIDTVEKALKKAGITNMRVAHESAHFLAAIKNATDPEEKRRIIGRVFLKVQRKSLKAMSVNPRQWLLGQGTIYPDTIESGGTTHAHTIKTHHNRVKEIEALIQKGLVVEPLKDLYKDEVRALGRELQLPPALVDRQPFPGPGLGVRLICATEKSKPQNSTRIEAELRRRWKVTGKVLPIRSVGVQGDERSYAHTAALFAPLAQLSKYLAAVPEIIQKFPEINRVLFCLSTATAPRQCSFTPATITPHRVELLQKADAAAHAVCKKKGVLAHIWQMPVVLIPSSVTKEEESVVLRPVSSIDAMTAEPYVPAAAVLKEAAKNIMTLEGIGAVFLDITTKPPATIEWE